MNINNNGTHRGVTAPSTSDPRTRERHFEVERFVGRLAARVGDDGYPEQLSIVMVGEGTQFSIYTDMMSQFINFMLMRRIPIQEIYRHFGPLRSLKGSSAAASAGIADSTQDAILNYVFCWLAEEFAPAQSNGKQESSLEPDSQLALKM